MSIPLPQDGVSPTASTFSNADRKASLRARLRASTPVGLPKPKRRVEGWGMPEVLIDEEWSSADDLGAGWSSDDEGLIGVEDVDQLE